MEIDIREKSNDAINIIRFADAFNAEDMDEEDVIYSSTIRIPVDIDYGDFIEFDTEYVQVDHIPDLIRSLEKVLELKGD